MKSEKIIGTFLTIKYVVSLLALAYILLESYKIYIGKEIYISNALSLSFCIHIIISYIIYKCKDTSKEKEKITEELNVILTDFKQKDLNERG